MHDPADEVRGADLPTGRLPLHSRCHPGKRAAPVRDPGPPHRLRPVPWVRTAPAGLPGWQREWGENLILGLSEDEDHARPCPSPGPRASAPLHALAL